MERLLERLKRWGVRLSCTDGLEAYAVLIPQGLLYVVKEETTIKLDHARQPHRLVRIGRRSIVVPETRCRGGRQHGPVRPLRSQDQHPRSRIDVVLRPSRALPQSPPFAYRLQPHPHHEHRPRTPILARSLGPLRTPARGT